LRDRRANANIDVIVRASQQASKGLEGMAGGAGATAPYWLNVQEVPAAASPRADRPSGLVRLQDCLRRTEQPEAGQHGAAMRPRLATLAVRAAGDAEDVAEIPAKRIPTRNDPPGQPANAASVAERLRAASRDTRRSRHAASQPAMTRRRHTSSKLAPIACQSGQFRGSGLQN